MNRKETARQLLDPYWRRFSVIQHLDLTGNKIACKGMIVLAKGDLMGWFSNFFQRSQGPRSLMSQAFSRGDVLQFHRRGLLEKVYLFPLELGGREVEMNAVYLPPESAARKWEIDQKAGYLLKNGLLDRYSANPEYQGNCFIPFRITVEGAGRAPLLEVVEIEDVLI